MRYFIILSLVLIPLLWSCDKDDQTPSDFYKVREVAWNFLDKQSRSTVITQWENADVQEGVYQGKEVYEVRFNTTEDPMLGPIVIYVDKVNLKIVAQALRA